MNLKDKPAFPITKVEIFCHSDGSSSSAEVRYPGMTLLQHYAGLAMQMAPRECNFEEVAHIAIQQAQALITELEKVEGDG